MKTVYIGAVDGLSHALVERLTQEGNDVYFLSGKRPSRRRGVYRKARFYKIPRKDEDLQKLLQSIAPECVIFAGNRFLGDDEGSGSDEDVTLLARTLRAMPKEPPAKFILLSSTEVYGGDAGLADESRECLPRSERGVRFVREEELLNVYRRSHDLDATILRVSQLYTDRAQEGDEDFLSRLIVASADAQGQMADDVVQPLHVSDLADAVKRVMDGGYRYIYNVSGSFVTSTKCLYETAFGIGQPGQSAQSAQPGQSAQSAQPAQPGQSAQPGAAQSAQPIRWMGGGELPVRADSSLIRQELGWSDRHDVLDQLRSGEIAIERAPEAKQATEKRALPVFLRQCLENILVFAAFFCLELLCSQHELLSQVNWMMIYLIVIAVSYNIYWGACASVLGSLGFLCIKALHGVDQSTFYAFAGSMLTIFEFVFVGLIVSYTVNKLKEDKRSMRLDLELLEEEYEDLKAINDENILIKNEYEERLLATKSGFPKLYSMVSRLMVEEPDRILMETMNIISELVHANTVAVYKGDQGGSWLRLMGALNPPSAMFGNSWNLAEHPRIDDAARRGELFQGDLGSGEPAIVLPVVCEDARVLVVIRELPFESESLYYLNMLKTLSLVLRDSMGKALQYEKLSRKDNYVEDTNILRPKAFSRQIALAEEKREKGIAEYCVVQILHTGSLKKAARAIERLLRGTDCIGINKDKQLFILLNNTDPANLKYLQKRLSDQGVDIQLIPIEPARA